MSDIDSKLEQTEYPDYLEDGRFDKATPVHDWRNYVPSDLMYHWQELTLREKKIIYILASEQANKEEWE